MTPQPSPKFVSIWDARTLIFIPLLFERWTYIVCNFVYRIYIWISRKYLLIKVIKRNAEYHLGLEKIKMEDRKQRNNFFFTIYISIAQNNYENLEASVNRSFPKSANYIIISFQNIQIKLKIASIRDYRKHRNVKNVAQYRPSKETSNVEK